MNILYALRSIVKRLQKKSTDGPPTLLAIDHDDYHAKHVGWTADGKQFFLTGLFEPSWDAHAAREFLALFLFNKAGQLIGAEIDDLGSRAEFDIVEFDKLLNRRLKELSEFGEITSCRIEVAPFAVERFGLTFGLIPSPPEEKGDLWVVELLPGNFMAFFPPWNSGSYDT